MLKDNLDITGINESEIDKAVNFLAKGGVVAFPTETVYGIGADIYDEIAVKKIFDLKKRDYTKPLAAHLDSVDKVTEVAFEIPDEFYILAERFLPGPLSIILPKRKEILFIVSGSLPTIAVRIPDNKIASELIRKFGKPLAATSANLSGMIAPTTADEVREFIEKDVAMILDGGKCKYSQESTVISLVEKPPVLIREGIIKKEILEGVLKTKIIKL
jgi:L-threonylcarbamoyladenylate synthase